MRSMTASMKGGGPILERKADLPADSDNVRMSESLPEREMTLLRRIPEISQEGPVEIALMSQPERPGKGTQLDKDQIGFEGLKERFQRFEPLGVSVHGAHQKEAGEDIGSFLSIDHRHALPLISDPSERFFIRQEDGIQFTEVIDMDMSFEFGVPVSGKKNIRGHSQRLIYG